MSNKITQPVQDMEDVRQAVQKPERFVLQVGDTPYTLCPFPLLFEWVILEGDVECPEQSDPGYKAILFREMNRYVQMSRNKLSSFKEFIEHVFKE